MKYCMQYEVEVEDSVAKRRVGKKYTQILIDTCSKFILKTTFGMKCILTEID